MPERRVMRGVDCGEGRRIFSPGFARVGRDHRRTGDCTGDLLGIMGHGGVFRRHGSWEIRVLLVDRQLALLSCNQVRHISDLLNHRMRTQLRRTRSTQTCNR